jgi:hypothetical protein
LAIIRSASTISIICPGIPRHIATYLLATLFGQLGLRSLGLNSGTPEVLDPTFD